MKWLVLWALASLVFLLGYLFGVLLSRAGAAQSETDADETAALPLRSTWPKGERPARGRPVVAVVSRRRS